MIKISSQRSDMMDYPPISREEKCSSALMRVIFYEIGFGASVQSVSSEKVVFHTPILNHYDIVEVTGPEEEMKPFLSAILGLSVVNYDDNINHVASQLAGMNTLSAVGLMRMMYGKSRAFVSFVSVLAGMGVVTTTEDVDSIVKMTKLPQLDRDALFELLLEGEKMSEVLTMVK